MRFQLLATTTLATILAVGAPSFAAAQAADEAAGKAAVGLEEVVVTAERFKSTVQTTPVAVSAFSPRTLEERQVTNVANLANLVPGIVLVPTGGNVLSVRIVLRGAGQETGGILFDPAVSIYLDDVYQPRINGAFFDIFDVEGVEVLRGPQGTLYGRNSSGGAIKITTKRPSFDLTYGGDIAVGNYGLRSVRMYASGPLVRDTLAGSISVVSRRRDGLMKSPFYSEAKTAVDTGMVRGKLLYTPTGKFEIEASVDTMRDDSDPGLSVPLQVGVGVVDPAARPGRDLFTSELFGPLSGGITSTGGSVKVNYDLNDKVRISAISGYRNLRLYSIAPFWLTTAAQASGDGSRNVGNHYAMRDEFFSQELTATYTTDALKLVGGLYYFKEEGVMNYRAPLATPNDQSRDTLATAAFAQGTYTFANGLSLTAGIRGTRETVDIMQFYYTQRNFAQRDSKEFSGTSPKFGVSWQAQPNLLLYASYTKGFKSGGFNVVPPTANTGTGRDGAPTPYGPENLDSYEAGFKFTTSDNRFRLNAAVFQAKYDGLQLPVFFPGTVTSYTSNAAGATIKGAELEYSWQALDSLQVYGNLSINDGKYTSAFRCALADTSIVDCSNKNIKGVIPTKSVLGFIYTPELNISGSISVAGAWSFTDAYSNTVNNQVAETQFPRLNLLDGSVSWASPDNHWKVSLEGRNLTDERYVQNGLVLSNAARASVSAYPGEPRMVNVRVRANF